MTMQERISRCKQNKIPTIATFIVFLFVAIVGIFEKKNKSFGEVYAVFSAVLFFSFRPGSRD